MEHRAETWRQRLIGTDFQLKREIFYTFIQGRTDVPKSVETTIDADMPRTFPHVEWVTVNSGRVKRLLVMYAAVNKGDSYLQGFNYFMTLLLYVFKDTSHPEADAWWCFARIVGLIRPLMPDFNVVWFHWLRQHWMQQFYNKLDKRPLLQSILSKELEMFSSLVTVKWFMIWFSQTVVFTELFVLWDFLIEQPPQRLMKVYTLLTFEILEESASQVTYEWSNNPSKLMHTFLNLQVENIQGAIDRVRPKL